MRLVILILVILTSAFTATSQSRSETYSETRELLLKMDRTHANE
jgi:hypothetical protein